MRDDGLVRCESCGELVEILDRGSCLSCCDIERDMLCGHPRGCLVDTAEELYCAACHERGVVGGEWLNVIARLLGPIPCGGTDIEICERHIRACCKEVKS